MKHWQPYLAVVVSALVTCSAWAWQVVPGSDPLERTAAVDLIEILGADGADTPLTLATSEEFDASLPAIIVGTVATNSLIAAADAEQSFSVDPQQPESFHLVRRGERLYVVGASPKGAMNGTFRLIDLEGLSHPDLEVVGRPAFRYRVAGHKVNQSPPRDWSERDQARYYARHYINVVWGEKKEPPLSYEARQTYGLGLMAELRFPSSATDAWWDDPANAEAIYYHKPDSKRRVISPFSEAGRRWYFDGYRQLLEENPDTRILYAIFGDYNVIPGPESVRISDGQVHGHSREETMMRIMQIMREAIGERDIVARAWLWHAFYGRREAEIAFMRELTEAGFGVMYNEAGNNDDWIFKLDNFDDMALKTGEDGKTVLGPNYLSLVSAGGACESVNPVIGMPLPRVAAYKLHRLYQAGVRDFALWWGSGEGWAYQPNLEVLAEMVWRPELSESADQRPFNVDDPLIRTIARRDFGELADEVIEYWRLFDAALVTNAPLYRAAEADTQGPADEDGLRIYSWYQRMGTYTEAVFGGAYPEPIVPRVLSNTHRFRALLNWGIQPYTLQNYDAVLENLGAAQAHLALLLEADTSPAVAQRLEKMYRWSELYRLLLTTQAEHLRGLAIMHAHEGQPVESEAVRAAIEPLTRDAIATAESLIDLVRQFPENFNLTEPHEGVVRDQGSRDAVIRQIEGRIAAMEIWLEGMTNLAVGRPAQASSQDQSKDRGPENATDGDNATLWASQFSDDQWIQVDLAQRRPIALVVLHWKTAYAREYAVQVADGEQGPWRTVAHVTDGRDGIATVGLPSGTEARFVRIQGIERGSPYGYALREIEIYGPSK